MLVEIVLSGGILVAVLGIVDGARWRRSGATRELSPETAIREAMRGEEAGSVRAEFRRRGVCPPERPRGPGFLWGSH